jgi:hypothetical protein
MDVALAALSRRQTSVTKVQQILPSNHETSDLQGFPGEETCLVEPRLVAKPA